MLSMTTIRVCQAKGNLNDNPSFELIIIFHNICLHTNLHKRIKARIFKDNTWKLEFSIVSYTDIQTKIDYHLNKWIIICEKIKRRQISNN